MGTDIQMNLSAKLTSLRKQKGLTQMDLAKAECVPPGNIQVGGWHGCTKHG